MTHRKQHSSWMADILEQYDWHWRVAAWGKC